MAFFKPKSISDYVQIARRVMMRKWLIFGIFFTLTSAIAVLVWRKPPQFTSQALILVQAQKTKDLNTNVAKKIDAALRNLVPVIKSRTNIERIIGEYDLFKEERAKNKPMEWLVNEMRGKISVTQRGRDSFQVAFTHKNPLTAQLITDHLASIIIEQNETDELKDRRGAMERTQQMVEEYDLALKQITEKITKFRTDNHEILNIGQERDPLRALIQQLDVTNSALESAQARVASLLIELSAAQAAQPIEAPVQQNSVLLAKQAEVAAKRAELANLKNKYTAVHPDVMKATGELSKLRSELAAIKRESDRSARRPRRTGNPQAAAIRGEIATTKVEIKRLQKERDRLDERIKTVEERNPQVPAVLAKLNEMEREQERLRKQIGEAEKQFADAKMLYQMELSERGDRFTVQDPANLPVSPSGLGRKVLLGIGGFVSLLAGILVALVMVYFDQTVYNEYELKRVTDLPVLVSIATYEPLQIKEKKKQRKQLRAEEKQQRKALT